MAHGSALTVFAPSARYFLTLAGVTDHELLATLGAHGCQLTPQSSPTTFGDLLASNRRITRYLVELPLPGSPDLLLDAALDAGVTVLELEPVFA